MNYMLHHIRTIILSTYLKIILTIPAVPVCYCSVYAQQWQERALGTEHTVRGTAFFNSSTGFAAVYDDKQFVARIYNTSNGGMNWSEVFTEPFRGVLAATVVDPKIGVVVGGAGTYLMGYKSSNSGSSWSSVFGENQVTAGVPTMHCVSFAGGVGYAGAMEGVVLRSSDKGSSWKVLPTRVDANNSSVIAIHFVTPTIGFAAVAAADNWHLGRGLYKTSDGGTSWKKITDLPVIRSIHFTDTETGYIAGSSGGVGCIWKSVDGGETWGKVYSGQTGWVNCAVFAPDNPFVGFAVGGNAVSNTAGFILTTVDGGETWSVEKTGLTNCLWWVASPSQSFACAVGAKGIAYTTEREGMPLLKPEMKIPRDTIDLGNVELAIENDLSFEVTPKNGAGLSVSSVVFQDPQFAASNGFSSVSTETLPKKLRLNQSLVINLKAKAMKEGIFTAALIVSTNDETTPEKLLTVKMTASKTVRPTVVLSVDTLHFGTVNVFRKAEKTFTISPENAAGLEIVSIQPLGDGNGFSVLPLQNLPVALTANESLGVKVSYDGKKGQNGVVAAEFIVETNDEVTPKKHITVSVSLLAAPVSVVSSDTLRFGEVGQDKSKEIKLYIRPENSAGLTVNNLTLSDEDAKIWSIKGIPTFPKILTLSDSLTVILVFNPKQTGSQRGTLNVSSNDSENASRKLVLEGTGIITSGINDEPLRNIGVKAEVTPLPFHSNGIINVSLEHSSTVDVSLISLDGQHTVRVYSGDASAGKHRYAIDCSLLPSGVYFCRITVGTISGVIPMIIEH